MGCPVDAGGVKNGCGYGLIARSHQGEAVGPGMGTCVGGSEALLNGKDSGWIGTGEVYGAVDNRVPLSADRRSR